MNAWLPNELKKYPVARKVLGVLLPPYWKNGMKMDASRYKSLYRQKLIDLVKRTPDYRMWMETYLGSGSVWLLSEKASPEEVMWNLLDNDDLGHPYGTLFMYLDRRASLEDVKEVWDLEDEYEEKVSEKEFVRELKNLDLGEYLELAVKTP